MTEPPLGVAGAWGEAEIALHRRFDELHQLIYTTGGIRPSGAAVEELAKLVLIRLWSPLLFETADPGWFATAFARALRDPTLRTRDPLGRDHPLWPLDEPFRLTAPTVLGPAAALISALPEGGDALGTAFDALLAGRHDHAGGLGTYLTPSGVASAMAAIAMSLVDTPPTMVLDPFCGTGRFLIAALQRLRPVGRPVEVLGADQSASALAKAGLNLLLYGVHNPLLWTVADSVTDDALARLVGAVPLILTNPPFGEGKYTSPAGLAVTADLMPTLAGRKRIDPSLAGLALCARLLAPGGVLGIILPDGVIAAPAFGSVVDALSLDVQVSLPAATFSLGGTVARTSAVFLRRGPARPRVAVARVAHVGFLRRAGRAAPDPAGSDLPALPALISAALATDGVVSSAPLVAGTSYPPDFDALDPTALDARAAGSIPLRSLMASAPIRRARVAAAPFLSVLHIDDLGTVDWSAVAANTPLTPGLLASPGDLVVSLLNPSKPRATVIPAPMQVSAEFGIFHCAIDPHAVLGLLYTEAVQAQLRPLGRGTSSSRRRITPADVLAVTVPALAPDELDRLATTVRDSLAQLTAARAALRAAYNAIGASTRVDTTPHVNSN